MSETTLDQLQVLAKLADTARLHLRIAAQSYTIARAQEHAIIADQSVAELQERLRVAVRKGDAIS